MIILSNILDVNSALIIFMTFSYRGLITSNTIRNILSGFFNCMTLVLENRDQDIPFNFLKYYITFSKLYYTCF